MAKKTIYLTGTTAISPRKSNFYKIMGLLLFVFSGYQIYNVIMIQAELQFNLDNLTEILLNLNNINSLIIFIIAIAFIFKGFQWINRKTNQYIKFEKDKIIYKPSYLKEPKSIEISYLKEIVYSPSWILCNSEKEKFMIDLSWVSTHIARRIKEAIYKIAEEKQIQIKGHTKL